MGILDIEAVRNTRFEELQDEIKRLEWKSCMAEVWLNAATHFSKSFHISRRLRELQKSRWAYVPGTLAWSQRRAYERALDEELQR